MRDDLLPCSFCNSMGLDVRSGTEDREGFPTSICCQSCGSNGPCLYTRDRHADALVADEWNTRAINGHMVMLRREIAGVVSPDAAWVALCGSYMHGPCENWQDVENQIRNEWEHDRHLAG